jgi:uncharacterized protein (DUF983 family)
MAQTIHSFLTMFHKEIIVAFLDHFQTKCPVCKQKLKIKAKLFGSNVPAGQCHACQAELRWVRSSQKTTIFIICGAIAAVLGLFVSTLIKGTMSPLNQLIGQVLGISLALGYIGGKELAVIQAPDK